MQQARLVGARAYPYLLALTFAMTTFGPDALNAGMVTFVGLLFGGILCLLGAFGRPTPLSAEQKWALALWAATAVWFAVTSSLADNPTASMFGLVGQHNGAALWALGAIWLAAGMLVADARTLRETLLAIALSGVVYTAGSLYEAARDGLFREQGFAAGFFDNSTSLGEFLAIASLTGLVVMLTGGSKSIRTAGAAAGLTSVIGLLASSSRTGLVGLVLALGYAAALHFLHDGRTRRLLPVISVAMATTATLLLLVSATGSLGLGLQKAVASIGTQRDVIWRSAVAQLQQAPLIGSGLEQFSAWINWSIGANGLVSDATADPHNVLLAAALGGGIAGIVLVLAAFVALLTALASVVPAHGRFAAKVIASFPVVLLGAGMVGWLAPAVMLAVMALSGSAIGVVRTRAASQTSAKSATSWGYVAAGLAALVLAVPGLRALPTQYAYVQELLTRSSGSSERLSVLYERWPDPGFASAALAQLVPQVQAQDAAATALAGDLLSGTAADARWRVELAVNRMLIAQALEAQSAERFTQFVEATEAGAQADPASGLWWTFAAQEASRLGLVEEAAEYAQRALNYPQDEETAGHLKRLANPAPAK